MAKLLERKDQTRENTWALEDIFPTDEAWQAALEEAKAFLNRVRALEGHLADSGAKLLECLKLGDEMNVAFDALVNYAYRKADEDTRVAKYQDMMAQLSSLLVAINTAGSYEDNEILAISDDKLEQFYQDEPDLQLYRRNLDRIRRKREHILSPAEEALLASAGEMAECPDNIFSMLNDADMRYPDAVDSKGEHHAVTHGSFIPLMYSQDRGLRKSAFESLYSVYDQFKNTSAATLSAQTKQLLFFSKARKYGSSLEALWIRRRCLWRSITT